MKNSAKQQTEAARRKNERKIEQTPRDDVEEASMESFPASDPPSSHHAEPSDEEIDANKKQGK